MSLQWLLLVLQWLPVWLIMRTGKATRDRLAVAMLIDEIPPWGRRGLAWQALSRVKSWQVAMYRCLLIDPDPLFYEVYTIIEIELAKELLRVDFYRRLWIDRAVEQTSKR